MRLGRKRILSIAVRSGRMGAVLIEGNELLYWTGFDTAGKGQQKIKAKLADWLHYWQPDLLLSENPDSPGYKSGLALKLIKAIDTIGLEHGIEQRLIIRHCPYANVYEEAAILVKYFPDLADILPQKPPIWGKEPYSLIFFEALVIVRESGVCSHLFADEESRL